MSIPAECPGLDAFFRSTVSTLPMGLYSPSPIVESSALIQPLTALFSVTYDWIPNCHSRRGQVVISTRIRCLGSRGRQTVKWSLRSAVS